jgi:hypothetical protein
VTPYVTEVIIRRLAHRLVEQLGVAIDQYLERTLLAAEVMVEGRLSGLRVK